jgi:hypothetical protein
MEVSVDSYAPSRHWIGGWIVWEQNDFMSWFGIDPRFVGRSACSCCYSGSQHRCLRLLNVTHNETDDAGLEILLYSYVREAFCSNSDRNRQLKSLQSDAGSHNRFLPNPFKSSSICHTKLCSLVTESGV